MHKSAVVSSSVYDAYGKETTSNELGDPFKYDARWGYYRDDETNLYLCRARYYDANLGRWLSRDPVGFAGGVNLYGYCESVPIGSDDPEGLCAGPLDRDFTKKMCRQLCDDMNPPGVPGGRIGRIIQHQRDLCHLGCEAIGAKGTRRLFCQGIEAYISHLRRHPGEGYKSIKNKQMIERLLLLYNGLGCPGNLVDPSNG